MYEGRKPEYPEKIPWRRVSEVTHSTVQRFKRDSNPHNSIGGRLGKQTCQPLHDALNTDQEQLYQKCITAMFTTAKALLSTDLYSLLMHNIPTPDPPTPAGDNEGN